MPSRYTSLRKTYLRRKSSRSRTRYFNYIDKKAPKNASPGNYVLRGSKLKKTSRPNSTKYSHYHVSSNGRTMWCDAKLQKCKPIRR